MPDEESQGLSESDVIDEVQSMFSAGQGTISKTMSWFSYLLAKNQDWQEKCRVEVTEVCGSDGEILSEDISKLKILSRCLNETLRLYPVGSFVGRTLTSDMTFKNPYHPPQTITLDKGTSVAIHFYALHHHPDFWESPEVFDPDRFTLERSKGRSPFAYLPFSGGSRSPVERVAMKVNRARKKILNSSESRWGDLSLATASWLAGSTVSCNRNQDQFLTTTLRKITIQDKPYSLVEYRGTKNCKPTVNRISRKSPLNGRNIKMFTESYGWNKLASFVPSRLKVPKCLIRMALSITGLNTMMTSKREPDQGVGQAADQALFFTNSVVFVKRKVNWSKKLERP
ncbi:unnamed protein product [Clavelina lepadiformis]|uniref:Cytochrome P450 n=1 Tax=Clavelina lepadiformis TaxID=159417 RepID=A0ABP0GH29_CLALP